MAGHIRRVQIALRLAVLTPSTPTMSRSCAKNVSVTGLYGHLRLRRLLPRATPNQQSAQGAAKQARQGNFRIGRCAVQAAFLLIQTPQRRQHSVNASLKSDPSTLLGTHTHLLVNLHR
ncbi:MAG: hypothetical protein R3E31_10350 [Chloroflexota bacterium]